MSESKDTGATAFGIRIYRYRIAGEERVAMHFPEKINCFDLSREEIKEFQNILAEVAG
ncbi:hypothetical protein QP907_00415 [Corynebacterium pseudodiphtheriticum]|uniref:hypothetical protein n=1 Tax=Corynebacterium pseudodiphtheriticum TaxID=37637 RepID=UPI00254AB913|nr:hypothetical protein [Corynebacterium pseudodiphtheriticum]MDK8550789.1 hypothetical protein [Corynebacterium pseudodiphtheriticum]